jgi:hypothetical protein
MLEKYIIVEDMETKKLSVISNTEYRKENDKNIIQKYEAISDAETMEKAEAILAHIREVGGVQNYFTKIMDKMHFHTVKTTEQTVVSIVEKLPDGYVRVKQLDNSLYKIIDEGTTEQEDAIMVMLGSNIKLRKCKLGERN